MSNTEFRDSTDAFHADNVKIVATEAGMFRFSLG